MNQKIYNELNGFKYWINSHKKISLNHNYHIPWYVIIYSRISNYFYDNHKNNDKWFGKINF